ncbi:MAG: replication initiator protein [Arizlama microvirus]|nr:MAG: replication initiator protein [Arizlama microvirus]
MNCIKPILLHPKNQSEIIQKYPDGLEVPCGKCLACRIAKRREWTLRLLHETGFHENSIFVTLTYSDEHLPFKKNIQAERDLEYGFQPYPTLVKRDLQLFIKRLRKALGKKKIKYYACGEYGDLTQRSHYHLILFNLSLKEIDKSYIMDNWPYCDWNIPAIRKNSFGMAETHSIQYVAQYIDKKLSGTEAEIEYDFKNREPVFRILSLGIGKKYALKNKKQIQDMGYCTVRGSKHSIPRYYINILDLDIEKIKQNALINESESVEKISGINSSKIGYYKTQKPSDVVNLSEGIKSYSIQNERNLTAKIKLKQKTQI